MAISTITMTDLSPYEIKSEGNGILISALQETVKDKIFTIIDIFCIGEAAKIAQLVQVDKQSIDIIAGLFYMKKDKYRIRIDSPEQIKLYVTIKKPKTLDLGEENASEKFKGEK